MNISNAIASALLDSQTGEFMKSYAKNRALKYEYLPGRGWKVLSVIRQAFDGSKTYIGEIQRLYKYPETWLVVTVAARTFYYGQDREMDTVTRPEQHPSKEVVGTYRTPKEASDKLWELYEHK
jgi:hypothetical protein